jgi:hypothetical protein
MSKVSKVRVKHVETPRQIRQGLGAGLEYSARISRSACITPIMGRRLEPQAVVAERGEHLPLIW